MSSVSIAIDVFAEAFALVMYKPTCRETTVSHHATRGNVLQRQGGTIASNEYSILLEKATIAKEKMRTQKNGCRSK